MTLYIDSSVLLKRYLDEPDAVRADQLLMSDADLLTARHTTVEVRRALARDLVGNELLDARKRFRIDIAEFTMVELTASVCDAAAEIAESTGLRTLDALHLGAAQESGGGEHPIVTFDFRQARAARSLGWTVLGL